MYTYTHIYIYIYIYAYIYIYIYACIHIYIYIYIATKRLANTSTHAYLRLYLEHGISHAIIHEHGMSQAIIHVLADESWSGILAFYCLC